MRRSTAAFLFVGIMLAAAGYGATFLLSAYYRARGGSDLDTGMTLGAAMVGTFVGVPLVGWFSARIDPARISAGGAGALALGFLLLAVAKGEGILLTVTSGFLIGFGWGSVYVGAPMALADRLRGGDRVLWFTRFNAFLMAGIGGGPIVLDFANDRLKIPVDATFALVAAACVLAALFLWSFSVFVPWAPRSAGLRPWVRPIAVIGRSTSIRPILMVALGACVFSGLLTFQSSLTQGTRANAATFFVVYAVTVVTARLVLARILGALPQEQLAIGLLISMTLGVVAMFGVSFHPAFQVLSAFLTGIGYGLVYAVIQTWVVTETPPQYQHAALTWFVLSYFVGVFGFPSIGGWVLVHLGQAAFLGTLIVASIAEFALAFVKLVEARAVSSAVKGLPSAPTLPGQPAFRA